MTAPPFILSPTSLTEFPAYWGERPELFADIAKGKNELERMERVLRWFICTLRGSYTVSHQAHANAELRLLTLLVLAWIDPKRKDGLGEETPQPSSR